MSSFFDELAAYLDTQQELIIFTEDEGRNTFLDELPEDPEDCVAFFGLVGTTLNASRDVKELQFPRFQVITRSADYETANTLLQAVRASLHGIIGLQLDNWKIMRLHAEQDGGPIGRDDQGRHEFSINMIGEIYAYTPPEEP